MQARILAILISALVAVAPSQATVDGVTLFDQMLAAIDHNDPTAVVKLLRSGLDPNLTEDTFLTYAALHGRRRVVEILLKSGARLEAQDGDGCTALIMSARGGHPETVRFLLHKGASLSARCSAGTSALSAAAAGHHSEVVRILKAAGASQ